MKSPKLFAALLALTLCFACSSDTLPKYSVIQGLRVLALTLDSPEVNFDGSTFTPNSVILTPWVSDLYGSGRTLKTNVYWCIDPGVGSGASPTCSGNSSLTSVVSEQTVSATATFLTPNYTGSISPVTISLSGLSATVQATLAATYSKLTSAQVFNGYSILIFFEIYPSSSTGEKITAFKRLVFSGSSKTTKNQNPSSVSVTSSGSEITSLPTSEVDLIASIGASDAETYSVLSSNGATASKTETVETAWFLTGPQDISCSKKKECTTDGYLNLLRSLPTESNHFTPPQVSTPTTRGRVLIVVAKDDRGGSIVKRYCDGTCP